MANVFKSNLNSDLNFFISNKIMKSKDQKCAPSKSFNKNSCFSLNNLKIIVEKVSKNIPQKIRIEKTKS